MPDVQTIDDIKKMAVDLGVEEYKESKETHLCNHCNKEAMYSKYMMPEHYNKYICKDCANSHYSGQELRLISSPNTYITIGGSLINNITNFARCF